MGSGEQTVLTYKILEISFIILNVPQK